ncbi:MAG: hypothetical protein HY519_02825 [Candidatus Aenigmarchaeota archaeon]|nr:hypothetical protein [Candidatus Aenigmarchaeota archaeon]
MEIYLTGDNVIDLLLLGLVIAGILSIVLRIAQHFLRALVVGIFCTLVPFIGLQLGLAMSTDVPTITWYFFTGIGLYFAAGAIRMGLKVTDTLFAPLKKAFETRKPKPKKVSR